MHAVFRQAAALAVCAAFAAGCASADQQKQTQAVFDTGVAAYDAKDYAKAFEIFSSIDDRDLAAMRNVALMLRKGVGTAKDPKAAEDMYARAAQGGLATAAADLGEMLLNGEAGPPDPKAAAPWLAGAAGAGHPVAAFELGQMFETGNGVPKDIEAARKLYKKAADGGMDEAKQRLAALPPPQAAPPATHKP
jgi:TPR repeat protein